MLVLFEKLKVDSCGWRIIWWVEVQNEVRVVGPDQIMFSLGGHGREFGSQLFSLTIVKDEKGYPLEPIYLCH